MATIEEKCENIMKLHPETRNHDSELYIEYSIMFWWPFFTKAQREWMKKNPFETISRARRKVQEKNKSLKSDDEIEIQREIKEREFKEKYGTPRNFFKAIQTKLRE